MSCFLVARIKLIFHKSGRATQSIVSTQKVRGRNYMQENYTRTATWIFLDRFTLTTQENCSQLLWLYFLNVLLINWLIRFSVLISLVDFIVIIEFGLATRNTDQRPNENLWGCDLSYRISAMRITRHISLVMLIVDDLVALLIRYVSHFLSDIIAPFQIFKCWFEAQDRICM